MGEGYKCVIYNTAVMDFKKRIEDFYLVFLDLETTGLNAVIGDSICEIGALKVKDGKIVDKFHSLVNPKKSVPKEAYSIHKISDEELKGAPYFEEVSDKLVYFLKDCVICAYNAGFDMGFINHQLRKIDCVPLNMVAVDILSMARDALKLSRYNLEAVANHFNIDCSGGLHRALDDALIAYKVFLKLKGIFKQRKIETLEEFVSLYGLESEVFKSKEDQKMLVFNEAIDRNVPLKIKYFPLNSAMEEGTIIPLRVVQEKKRFSLLCQKPKELSFRINLNRIFEVEIAKE